MLTETVTPLPSGTYGSYTPARVQPYETRPVVQVAQLIRGDWYGTPARHYAESLPASGRLSIDSGQGWALSPEDTAAHAAYGAALLTSTTA